MKTHKRIYLPSWTEVLLYLYESPKRNDGSKIYRNVPPTYSHVHHLLGDLEKKGLVESEKPGRSRYYFLTKEGERIAGHLSRIKKYVD